MCVRSHMLRSRMQVCGSIGSPASLRKAALERTNPRAGAGSSVEAVAGGGPVPIGWGTGRSRWCHPELRHRLLRLTLLAPDIVLAILEARQSKAMQLEELTDGIPSEWEEQREAISSGAA
jgi:hypothetical protein